MSEAEISPEVKPKVKPIDGRRARNLSPIKNWSGGMSAKEVANWESIADKCREGVKPSIAAAALGYRQALQDLRRRQHPVVDMLEEAWAEGRQLLLEKIRVADSWQSASWMLERQDPMEFAVDSAIRGQLNELAQEAGFTSADLLDAVRMIQDAKESGVDLAEVLRQAKVDLHGTEPVEGDQSPFQAP